jgi:Arc/MetJ-type ribon-helix-helix transcriptional regulator
MPYMSDNKVKVTASMDVDLVEWIDREVGTRRFASRTHALEFATSRLKNEIEKGQA